MAITVVGYASATGTSVTLPGFTPGDIAFVFAFRDGTSSTPGEDTAYDRLIYDEAGYSGTACAFGLGYRVLLGGETTTTWAAASEVQVLILSGVGPMPRGNIAILGGTSTTPEYDGFTLKEDDGTSVLLGFVGHRTATNVHSGTPTNWTNRSSGGTATALGCHTAASSAGWQDQTYTVNASSEWRAVVIELLAPPASVPNTYAEEVLSGTPVTYWKLDGDDSNAILDSSGNGYNLTIPASADAICPSQASLLPTEPSGNCRQFGQAPTPYRTLELTDSTPIKFLGTNPFSVECWYDPLYSGSASYLNITGWSNQSASNANTNNYAFFLHQTFGLTFARKVAGAYVDPGYYVPANKDVVHYIVGVYTGTTVQMWVDGYLRRTAADTRSAPTWEACFLNIGTSQFGGNRYNGLIDNYAIYDHALSQAEIEARFMAGYIDKAVVEKQALYATRRRSWR